MDHLTCVADGQTMLSMPSSSFQRHNTLVLVTIENVNKVRHRPLHCYPCPKCTFRRNCLWPLVQTKLPLHLYSRGEHGGP